MKKARPKVIIIAIVWTFLAWVIVRVLITPNQNSKNTTSIKGHFDQIIEGVGTGRASGSLWFDLYLKENNGFYRISADNSRCFWFSNFQHEVKKGDPIQIYLNEPVPFFSIKNIVSVAANGNEYLSFQCVNDKIEEDRKKVPLNSIGLGVLITLLVYKKSIALRFKTSNINKQGKP